MLAGGGWSVRICSRNPAFWCVVSTEASPISRKSRIIFFLIVFFILRWRSRVLYLFFEWGLLGSEKLRGFSLSSLLVAFQTSRTSLIFLSVFEDDIFSLFLEGIYNFGFIPLFFNSHVHVSSLQFNLTFLFVSFILFKLLYFLFHFKSLFKSFFLTFFEENHFLRFDFNQIILCTRFNKPIL